MTCLLRMSALLSSVLLVASGCGSDGCEVVCKKNVECQIDSPGEAACNDLCEKLSADSAYADAIDAQADCYDGASCDEIRAGNCQADGT